MEEIELTQGYVALVDDEDYELVSERSWYAQKVPKSEIVYAVSNNSRHASSRGLLMHRFILDPGETLVDHIDGDGLNNRRENLRLATHSQNMQNRRKGCNNTSGYIGVWWDPTTNQWRAELRHAGNRWRRGGFKTALDAAVARDAAAKELHGEFARLNFPQT
jgi:hypothetical protein